MSNFEPKIKLIDNQRKVFDPIRKKYVALTPEEAVRQQFIHFLSTERGVPQSLIAVEGSLTLNGMQKRFDILVYNRNGNALLLVECKAPTVKINNNTFEQIARYNLSLKVPYLVVTNGDSNYCCRVNFENQSINFLKNIPFYKEMVEDNS